MENQRQRMLSTLLMLAVLAAAMLLPLIDASKKGKQVHSIITQKWSFWLRCACCVLLDQCAASPFVAGLLCISKGLMYRCKLEQRVKSRSSGLFAFFRKNSFCGLSKRECERGRESSRLHLTFGLPLILSFWVINIKQAPSSSSLSLSLSTAPAADQLLLEG